MRLRGHGKDENKKKRAKGQKEEEALKLPQPSASYRRRAWTQFQRALDPLAPLKPPPRQPRT